ncbi:MAG: hypothetical protein RTU92_12395 [Candidatus Thorarchaeota archaeon]
MPDCMICGRDTLEDSEFCAYHSKAQENLREAFVLWQKGLEISWDDYLNRVQNLESLGKWVRDVVEYIISENDS